MKEKFSLYQLFYRSHRDDKKEIKKEKKRPLNLVNFFVTLPRRFGKLVSINILMVIGSFPLLFPLIAYSGTFSQSVAAPAYDLFAPVYNLVLHGATPAVSSLYGIYGVQAQVTIPTTTTFVFYALGFLLAFTMGPLCTGSAYLLRNLVRGDPVFVVSDFFYALKRNFWQGLLVGFLDFVMLFMLGYDIIWFYSAQGSTLTGILFILSLIMALIYFFMRFYLYLMLVTFDLKTFKLFKNALIFSFLGIWRNLAATLGMVVILLIVLGLSALFFPLAFAVVLVFGVAMCAYMATYAAYGKVKTYMIDPYYTEEEETYSYYDEEDPDSEGTDPDDESSNPEEGTEI